MGILIGLMIFGAVCWLVWVTLWGQAKVEAVSRDLEAAMTEEAIQRVKDSIEIKVNEWKDARGK